MVRPFASRAGVPLKTQWEDPDYQLEQLRRKVPPGSLMARIADQLFADRMLQDIEQSAAARDGIEGSG